MNFCSDTAIFTAIKPNATKLNCNYTEIKTNASPSK